MRAIRAADGGVGRAPADGRPEEEIAAGITAADPRALPSGWWWGPSTAVAPDGGRTGAGVMLA
ncbi:hypothetical protein ACWC2M_38690, partial [Streptomyces sp. NPDC001761]